MTAWLIEVVKDGQTTSYYQGLLRGYGSLDTARRYVSRGEARQDMHILAEGVSLSGNGRHLRTEEHIWE